MGIVNPNPSQFRFLDYGAAVKAGEDIKYGRLRNEALGMEVEETQNMLANRKKAQDIREQTEGMPNQIAALEEMGLFDEADKMRDTYIKSITANAKMIDDVANKLTPENYDGIREKFLKSGAIMPEMWPETYDPKWARDQAAQTRSNLSRLTRKWAQDGAIMSQDLVQQDGEILWEGEPYADPDDLPKDGTGAGFKFTASDSNAIGKQSERLYGGFYDPATGRISGLDPDQAAKVAQVQEEAERLYSQAQGSMTHAIALAQAARKMGINIQSTSDAEVNDPLGIRP